MWRVFYYLMSQSDRSLSRKAGYESSTNSSGSIIDQHFLGTSIWYDLPVYDFVRGEPEFKVIMDTLKAELAEQLKRVRAMECAGELAPSPGVELRVDCN